MIVKYYTDGSTRNNGLNNAAGAWGFICLEENFPIRRWAAGVKGTTNQRMELTAMIEACKDAEDYYPNFKDIEFYTDSAYIHNCYIQRWYEKWLQNGWVNSKKEPVANRDLWEKLIPYFEKPNFKFYKIKGHSNDKWNNEIDNEVQKISKELQCK